MTGTGLTVAGTSLRSGLDTDGSLEWPSWKLSSKQSLDAELNALQGKVEGATAEAQRETEERFRALENRLTQKAETSLLRAELEKLKALKEVRDESQTGNEA